VPLAVRYIIQTVQDALNFFPIESPSSHGKLISNKNI